MKMLSLKRYRNALLLVPLFAAGMTSAYQGTMKPVAQPPVIVDRSVVLVGKEAQALFKQCSRQDPQSVTGYWNPTAQDLKNLNAALPTYLKTLKLSDTERKLGLADYYHQCAGFTRKEKGVERRYLYVNAFHPRTKKDWDEMAKREKDPKFRTDWKKRAVIVCDGGGYFFGVEYDTQTKQFSHLAFNGRG
jgi:hypothetical protein